MSTASRKLSPPDWNRLGSLGNSLLSRRSVRKFEPESIPEEDLSLLLASACGVSDEAEGLRTAPFGGACYPLGLYIVTEKGVEAVTGLLGVVGRGEAICIVPVGRPLMK